LIGEAAFLVFPSEWYETFGRVAIEAFAKGTPVIAANIGAIAELIDNGRTGILYSPGQPEDLRAKVEWALTHPSELAQMRKEARAEFEAKYTVEQNYQILMSVYERAMSH
jgi:glycosyltransferase involved in cell wall biosynthesis